MESTLEILILLLVLSSLCVIYSGNDKNTLGRKVKAIGFQLLSGAFISLGALYSFNDSSVVQDILFYIGSFIWLAGVFQLCHSIKKLVLKST